MNSNHYCMTSNNVQMILAFRMTFRIKFNNFIVAQISCMINDLKGPATISHNDTGGYHNSNHKLRLKNYKSNSLVKYSFSLCPREQSKPSFDCCPDFLIKYLRLSHSFVFLLRKTNIFCCFRLSHFTCHSYNPVIEERSGKVWIYVIALVQ